MSILLARLSREWSSAASGAGVALSKLRLHPLRTALSICGVILGVASLVAILTVLGAVRRLAESQFTSVTSATTLKVVQRQ
jgi:hypothetical protein